VWWWYSTASAIVAAALDEASKHGGPAEAEVKELVSDEIFQESCSGKKLCIIAFLKDILDESVASAGAGTAGCVCVWVG
jgi:hypothetical protein